MDKITFRIYPASNAASITKEEYETAFQQMKSEYFSQSNHINTFKEDYRIRYGWDNYKKHSRFAIFSNSISAIDTTSFSIIDNYNFLLDINIEHDINIELDYMLNNLGNIKVYPTAFVDGLPTSALFDMLLNVSYFVDDHGVTIQRDDKIIHYSNKGKICYLLKNDIYTDALDYHTVAGNLDNSIIKFADIMYYTKISDPVYAAYVEFDAPFLLNGDSFVSEITSVELNDNYFIKYIDQISEMITAINKLGVCYPVDVIKLTDRFKDDTGYWLVYPIELTSTLENFVDAQKTYLETVLSGNNLSISDRNTLINYAGQKWKI